MPKLDLAELKRLEELSEKATQGEWAIYDSNSWRRFGLTKGYKEFLWPCVGRDGHPDLSGINREHDLEFIAALVNFFRANSAALLEASRDRERLDWFDKHHFSCYRQRDPESARLHNHVCLVDEDKQPRTGTVEDTLRAAIDSKLRENE